MNQPTQEVPRSGCFVVLGMVTCGFLSLLSISVSLANSEPVWLLGSALMAFLCVALFRRWRDDADRIQPEDYGDGLKIQPRNDPTSDRDS
jgi:hypothetical protein